MINQGDETVLKSLENGELNIQGEFMWGSNYTFLARVEYQHAQLQAVYKPTRGERPLWDFPPASLAGREVAAYLVSEALGWRMVPPTVFRKKGPLGPGSLQAFVEHDPEYHYFTFNESDRQRLRPVALFDLLINNADRKGSHVLIEKGPRKLWAIDHGLCFHEEDKLRTVLWDFSGEPIPNDLLECIETLPNLLASGASLRRALQPYLEPSELSALVARAKAVLRSPIFPFRPRDRRAYPYPPI